MSDLRTDHGPNPYVVDIEKVTLDNENFRDTLWTGKHIQMTVMSIPAGGEVGAEVHDSNDQFIRVEQGKAHVKVGASEDNLDLDEIVEDDWSAFIPSGSWHNILNAGDEPLKLYSIYGPADHVAGTIHKTFEDAENDPNEQHD